VSRGRVRRAVAAAAALLGTVLQLAACDAGRPPRNELRFRTDDFVIRVASETRPVRALEPIQWRVTVHDARTGLPIQGGQGRIFATNRDRKTVANGLEETGELGTYRSNLMYVTAGMWAMAIQFRRDTTQALQKTQDWTQDILSADEPGDFTTPQSTRVPAAPPPPPPPGGGGAPPARAP
jgi:hypothetical protein